MSILQNRISQKYVIKQLIIFFLSNPAKNKKCQQSNKLYRLEKYNRPIIALFNCSKYFNHGINDCKFTKQLGLFCKYNSHYNIF